jgi:hypothetical protein
VTTVDGEPWNARHSGKMRGNGAAIGTYFALNKHKFFLKCFVDRLKEELILLSKIIHESCHQSLEEITEYSRCPFV